jgi:hypothetical protein
MNFKNIMIHQVKTHYTAQHIAFTLLTKEICHLSSITLIPQIADGEIFNIAYIDVGTYCDTEAAYDFIHSIKHGVFILPHDNDNDNPWTFQLNIHNSGGLCVGDFTTQFPQKDYNNYTNFNNKLNYTNSSSSELQEFKPIIGLSDEHYSFDEALQHFHLLIQQWHSVNTAVQRRLIEQNIQHFDNELRIHHSVINSQHVSSR